MVTIKDTKHIAAREVSVKIERNKVYPEGPVVNILLHTVDSDYGKPGIDQAEEVLVLGPKLNVIGREGVKYVLPGGQWFKGEQALREHLHANPATVAELRQAMIALNAPVSLTEAAPEDEVEVEAPIGHNPQLMDREVFRQVAAEAPTSPQEPLKAEEAPSPPSEVSEASWTPPDGGWDDAYAQDWE
jgi:hypothetical protein